MDIETLFKISYGLYVVSSKWKNKLNGFISNTVFQVTAEPVQLAVVCSKNNFTTGLINQSKILSVSALQQETSTETMSVFGYKTGREIDKFTGFQFKTGKTGVPILLRDTIAWYEGEVVETFDVGSHLIFIMKVLDCETLDENKLPLIYAYYRDVKKGKAPKNAPTFVDPGKLIVKAETIQLDRYKCSACGYVYDPAEGDRDALIRSGTAFKDLPDSWCCPICGVDKSFFEKE